jgi:hypothetical protein
MARTVQQVREELTVKNPLNESDAFLAQQATTDVTKQAQIAAGPLDQLAELMKVPVPAATQAVTSPWFSYADAFKPQAVQLTDSVAKASRNPLRTDQDLTNEFGLQIPV